MFHAEDIYPETVAKTPGALRAAKRLSQPTVSLLTARPRRSFSDERVPINIAPEARKRLNDLLNSEAYAGSGIGYSAFIDRACEAAETEIAQR